MNTPTWSCLMSSPNGEMALLNERWDSIDIDNFEAANTIRPKPRPNSIPNPFDSNGIRRSPFSEVGSPWNSNSSPFAQVSRVHVTNPTSGLGDSGGNSSTYSITEQYSYAPATSNDRAHPYMTSYPSYLSYPSSYGQQSPHASTISISNQDPFTSPNSGNASRPNNDPPFSSTTTVLTRNSSSHPVTPATRLEDSEVTHAAGLLSFKPTRIAEPERRGLGDPSSHLGANYMKHAPNSIVAAPSSTNIASSSVNHTQKDVLKTARRLSNSGDTGKPRTYSIIYSVVK
jgi:hypothetical protein